MPIKPQNEAADRDQPYPSIRHKRVGIDESRSDNAVPPRQRKREKTVSSVGTTDDGNRPEEEVRPRGISAELKSNPEDACSRDQPQEGQGGQIAIDTDATFDGPI